MTFALNRGDAVGQKWKHRGMSCQRTILPRHPAPPRGCHCGPTQPGGVDSPSVLRAAIHDKASEIGSAVLDFYRAICRLLVPTRGYAACDGHRRARRHLAASVGQVVANATTEVACSRRQIEFTHSPIAGHPAHDQRADGQKKETRFVVLRGAATGANLPVETVPASEVK
jgi:hypothetical protein